MSAAERKTSFLGLGSNLGNREELLRIAVETLAGMQHIDIVRCSGIYESDPWGYADQGKFLNAVIEIRSSLDPLDMLSSFKDLERSMGRESAERLHPRIIDIDILLSGERILRSPELSIPHPALPLRRFVLVPLAELAPDRIHPILKQSISGLLESCTDPGSVVRVSDGIVIC